MINHDAFFPAACLTPKMAKSRIGKWDEIMDDTVPVDIRKDAIVAVIRYRSWSDIDVESCDTEAYDPGAIYQLKLYGNHDLFIAWSGSMIELLDEICAKSYEELDRHYEERAQRAST